jgi:UDP-galactose transporter B1
MGSTAEPAKDSSLDSSSRPSDSSWMRLAFCAAGICVSYCWFGLLQERLFTGVHLGPAFCLITACLMNVMVALIWQFVEETFGKATCKSSDTTSTTNSQLPHKLLLATSFCYVVAMTCSNEAIPRVSYPVAVLAKSCKLLPTMLVGQLVERKAYSRSEWTAAVCISVGI